MNTESIQDRSEEFLPTSWPLLLVAFSLALGILTDRLLGDWPYSQPVIWWLLAVVATSTAATLMNFAFTRLSLIALLVAVASIGGTWHHFRWNNITRDEFARFAPEDPAPVCVEAIAASPVQHTPALLADPFRAIPAESQSQLLLQITKIRDGSSWLDTEGQTRLRINGTFKEIVPGDRLLVFAQLGRSRPAHNPGQYDYAATERAGGRFCELYTRSPECVTVLESVKELSPQRWLDWLSRKCHTQLSQYVGPSSGPIAQALLLGTRSELPDETLESFMETGTIHLLVVSGLHVGLLAAATWMLLSSLQVSQKWSLLVTAMLIIPYAAIVGGGPPVVRASVLVLMTLLGIAGARRASAINLIAASALVVLAINPSELFRGGTQLSFLGVAVVVGCLRPGWIQPVPTPLERMITSYMSWQELAFRWLWKQVKMLFLVSFLVWIFAAPLVLYHFNIITPSGFLISPMLWPFVALALVAGLGICTIGFLFPPVAWLLGKVCSMCLLVTESTVAWASQLRWGHEFAPGPPLWWLVGFYGALGLMVLVPKLQFNPRKLIALAAVWIAVGFAVASWKLTSKDELRCNFLAVGHGTCVVLELPGGATLLYDAGSLGSPESAANVVSGFLWSRGITHIDAVVISHADVDHYNALPGLMERFGVGSVYVSPLMFDPWANDGDLTAPILLKQRIMEAGVPMREVWMNDCLRVDDSEVVVDILHPPRFGVPGRDNANSIVLSVEYANTRILLPGDLESPGIELVMAEEPLDCDILLAPHHGSRFSDPPGFAAWCTPNWVVMSGGSSINSTSFASTSYRLWGARIFHTERRGAVEFSVSSRGIEQRQFLP